MVKRTLTDVLGDTDDTEAPAASTVGSKDFEAMRAKLAAAKQAQAEADEDTAGPEAGARSTYSANKKFDSAETSLPRLSLAQGLSPQVRDRTAQVGDFLLPGFENEQEVILVIAGHTTQRRYVPKGEQRAKCWSPDGIMGHGDPGIPCDECPLSQWMPTDVKDANGRTKNAPPPCAEIDSWAAFSVTHGVPLTWPLKGTAMQASRFLKGLCNSYGMGSFAVKVTPVTKTAPGRNWVAPEATLYKELDADQCLAYAKIAQAAVGIEQPLVSLEAEAANADY
jgi:hypothetical protein